MTAIVLAKKSEVEAETARAEAAEAAAKGSAASEVAAEKTAREAADAAERTARENADSAKASKAELTAETEARNTADSGEKSAREAADATEKARAEAAEATKAPLASPALTGVPTAPTATPLTDDAQIATTGYTDAAVAVEKSRAETVEAAKIPLTQRGAANGVATLDGKGLLPTGQLPPLSITDPYVVNSEAAQLALEAHKGDVAIRTDLNKSFIQNGGTAKTMADWTEIVTPGDVTSVNGHTGTVSLTAADVAAVPTSAEGVAGGVATLDSGGHVPLSELSSSVVSGSPTGGIEAWKAKTSYPANRLAQIDGIAIICKEAHVSGESWAGTGTHWEVLAAANQMPEFYGAQGNGVTDDTAAFQAASKYVAEKGGGTIALRAVEYIVDGLLWEAGVVWKGSGFRANGTVLKAKAGSSNEGQIMIPAGVVNKGGWEDICFKPSGANANQDCFYMYAREPESGGVGGVTEAFFTNIEITSGYRNCFWWRGGTANAKCPHQFITFKNVVGYRPTTGSTASTARVFKATGQCEKFETDAACSWNGATSVHVGTNWEIGREFLFSTTITAEAAAGASVIMVASTAGLESNKVFSLGEGAFNEICKVQSIAGNEVTLKAPLVFTHAAATNVYLLSGTVASPTTWSPSQWIFHCGAIQNADLAILADACTDIHFYGTDFENTSRILRRREKCLGVELHDVHVSIASEGKTNGNGTVTNGSATVTALTSVSIPWAEGDHIAGPGIPTGTTVTKVEGETLTLSKAVGSTGTGTAPVSVSLIRGSNGEGYIVMNESGSVGVDTYFVNGAVDRTVVNNGGSTRVRDVTRNSGLTVIQSSGVTLALEAASTLTILNAYEVVLTNAAAAVKNFNSVHAPHEHVTLRATTAKTKIEEGGNISVPGGLLEMGVGDVATFMRTDYGSFAWVLIAVQRASTSSSSLEPTILTASGSYAIPSTAKWLEITVVAGGGGGGGGGSASAAQLQVGGGAGAAGTEVVQIVGVGANTTATVTIGAGGAGGAGGEAGGHEGANGEIGADSKVVVGSTEVLAKGGKSGNKSGASATGAVGGGIYASTGTATGIGTRGSGGGSANAGGRPSGYAAGGGGGGGTATATNGGGAGGAGTKSEGGGVGANSGTSAGAEGESAAANSGAGGGGGGGGAAGTGAGGKGGKGGSGYVVIKPFL